MSILFRLIYCTFFSNRASVFMNSWSSFFASCEVGANLIRSKILFRSGLSLCCFYYLFFFTRRLEKGDWTFWLIDFIKSTSFFIHSLVLFLFKKILYPVGGHAYSGICDIHKLLNSADVKTLRALQQMFCTGKPHIHLVSSVSAKPHFLKFNQIKSYLF